jgi:D-lactate dehydrogenase (quinone)
LVVTSSQFLARLKEVVGSRQVLTGDRAIRRYATGFRWGTGQALAVVQPRSLVDLWRVVGACVAAGRIVVPQAANTGLTGGSTPASDGYDREVIIISMTQLATLHVIAGGRQVICLPGATLHQLERALRPYEREPHSVIGSSCIGASVIGGICNNSGGALLRRGPAYTEMALFARVTDPGRLELVNHLRVKLGDEPAEILRRLAQGQFTEADIEYAPGICASDQDYVRRVRNVDSDVPCRFNADHRRLHEAAGCAGRVIVFAVRLDTFPADKATRVFYIGTNDPSELTDMRRDILTSFRNLPVAGEYLHQHAFTIAEKYGKDTFMAVRYLGTDLLPKFFRIKAALDGHGISSDRVLQWLARILPSHLPQRMRKYRDLFQHHLLLKVADGGIEEARRYLSSIFPSRAGDFFECTAEEGTSAFLHRFAVAGAAIRYREIHADDVEEIVALDVALRANDRRWFEAMPGDVREPVHRLVVYGHFFCNVWHRDYLLKKGCDPDSVKQMLLRDLDARGAEYPAEHNVGHLYRAKPALVDFYRSLDPTNSFNPGIGKTSKLGGWKETTETPDNRSHESDLPAVPPA